MATSSAGSSQYTSTAVRVHEPGDSSVLRVDIDIPMAECGPNDVLVEIAYAGLNFIDCYQRSGLYPMKYPFVLGKEGSGIVRHIGSDVRTIHTGDRVGVMSQSTYATYTVAAEKDIVKLPDSVLLSDAAAVLLQGLTAHYLTHSTYPLKSGDICLTHASAGGTSALIVQMAKLRGATVIATAGSEAKCAIAKSLGADHVINYSETDFQSEVMRITNNKGVQVVYDGVGKSTWEKSMKSLSKLGHLVLFGNASGAVPPIDPLLLMKNGSLYVTRPTLFDYIFTPDAFQQRCDELFKYIADKRVQVRVGKTFSLADAAEAQLFIESRQSTGKILLAVNDQLQ